MKYNVIALALAITSITACNTIELEVINHNSEEGIFEFSAMTESAATKTTVGENGGVYEVKWASGDKIAISDDTNVGIYSTTSTESEGTFSFSSGTAVTGPAFKAYYPADNYNKTTGVYTLASSYTLGKGVFPKSALYAESDDTNLSFVNLLGFIKLNVKGTDTVKKIKQVVVTADQGLAGPITVTADASAFKAVASSENNRLTVSCSGSYQTLYQGFTFIIPVPAGSYTNLKFEIQSTNVLTDGFATKTANKAIVVERSKITTINLNNVSFDVAEGAGTEADPYLLKSEEDLARLSGANTSGKYFKIANDFTLTKPITPFDLSCKQLDGNNKTITIANGFNIPSSGGYYVGIFGTLTCDVINLNLTSTGTLQYVDIGNKLKYFGCLAGMFNGNMTNCSSSVDVEVTSYNVYYAGGLVGGYTSTISKTIKDCSNSGDITVNSTSANAPYAGGIIGDDRMLEVTGCSNSGAVTSMGIAGGIIGQINRNGTTVDGCVNTGAILATSNRVTSTGFDCSAIAGGILGLAYPNESYVTTILNCENHGSVCGIWTNGYTSSYNPYNGNVSVLAGGIVGRSFQSQTIENCSNLGDITAKYTCQSNLFRNAKPFAAGISGFNGVITNCASCGTLSSQYTDNDGYLKTCYYMGGIMGVSPYDSNNGTSVGSASGCFHYNCTTNLHTIAYRATSKGDVEQGNYDSAVKGVDGSTNSGFGSGLLTARDITGYEAGTSVVTILNAWASSDPTKYVGWKESAGKIVLE